MHGLKPHLRGVHMATLPVCVRGFAVSCKCTSVVRAMGSNCPKPLINISRPVRLDTCGQRGGIRFGRRRPSEAPGSIDAGRRMVASDPQCSCAMHGVHPEPLGEVARRLPVRGYLLHRRTLKENLLHCGRVRLARKASEPSKIARYPPRTLSEDTKTQVRGRIGQTGFMVYRGGSVPSGDAGHCKMQRRTRQNRHDGHKVLV